LRWYKKTRPNGIVKKKIRRPGEKKPPPGFGTDEMDDGGFPVGWNGKSHKPSSVFSTDKLYPEEPPSLPKKHPSCVFWLLPTGKKYKKNYIGLKNRGASAKNRLYISFDVPAGAWYANLAAYRRGVRPPKTGMFRPLPHPGPSDRP
jgi:hypothetical protein